MEYWLEIQEWRRRLHREWQLNNIKPLDVVILSCTEFISSKWMKDEIPTLARFVLFGSLDAVHGRYRQGFAARPAAKKSRVV